MKKIYSLFILVAFATVSFAQGTYTLVTSVNDLADAEYLIIGKIYSENDGNKIYTLGAQTNNNRSAILFSDTDSKAYTFGNTTDFGKIKITKEVGTNNIYTFQDIASALYLYAASSSGNQLKSKEVVDASAKFTVTIDAITGEATVVSTDATVRGHFRFNNTNNPPLFSCYNETSSVVNKIYFYKKQQTTSTNNPCMPNVNFVYDPYTLPSGSLVINESYPAIFRVQSQGTMNFSYEITMPQSFEISTNQANYGPSVSGTGQQFTTYVKLKSNLPTGTYNEVFTIRYNNNSETCNINISGTVTTLSESTFSKTPFTFYPNPTNNNLHFADYTDVTIYNLQGNKLAEYKNVKTIDVSQLPTGIYVLQTPKYGSHKIIKQ